MTKTSIPYTLLEFDSKLFGYTVARLENANISEAVSIARKNNIKLLYLFVRPSDTGKNEAAVAAGGFLIDERMEYCMDTQQTALRKEKKDLMIEPYQNNHPDNALIRLVMQAGIYSRFAVDKHFKSDEFKKLYSLWISKAVAHTKGFE